MGRDDDLIKMRCIAGDKVKATTSEMLTAVGNARRVVMCLVIPSSFAQNPNLGGGA